MAFLKVGDDGIVYKLAPNGSLEHFFFRGQRLHARSGYLYTDEQLRKLEKLGAAEPFSIRKEMEGYPDPRKNKKGIITTIEVPVADEDKFVYFSSALRRDEGLGTKPFPIENTDLE